MAAEEVLTLLETYWFETHVLGFGRKQPIKPDETAENSRQNDQETEQDIEQELQEEPKLSRFSSLHVRSFSDQNLSNSSSDFLSPESMIAPPKLQHVVSGNEVNGFSGEGAVKPEEREPSSAPVSSSKKQGIEKSGGKMRKRRGSRSLSELEFEEVKGFMDLGFVFSEEDKDSSLASILPGLQRLGKREKEKTEVKNQGTEVSRPYLSEAWEVLENRNVEFPIMNWRIPALGNGMDMKDQLRFWAHTVASTVR